MTSTGSPTITNIGGHKPTTLELNGLDDIREPIVSLEEIFYRKSQKGIVKRKLKRRKWENPQI